MSESAWERRVRLLLQVALGLLLCCLTLAVTFFLVFPAVAELANGISDAWLAFWGNILGGVLGFGGGLIAAVAAVVAVDRQFRHQRSEAQRAADELLGDMRLIFASSAQLTAQSLVDMIEALERKDLLVAVGHLRTAGLAHTNVDGPILATIAAKSARLAFVAKSLVQVVAIVEDLFSRVQWHHSRGFTFVIDKERISAGLAAHCAARGQALAAALRLYASTVSVGAPDQDTFWAKYSQGLEAVCERCEKLSLKYEAVHSSLGGSSHEVV